MASHLNVSLSKLLMSFKIESRVAAFVLLKDRNPSLSDSKDMREVVESINQHLSERLESESPLKDSTWRLIKNMGRQNELWIRAFQKADEGLRKKILTDVFNHDAIFSSRSEPLFEQAAQHLGRENVLIYRYAFYRADWPEHVWRWAIQTSSMPTMDPAQSPRGQAEEQINQEIHGLNSYLGHQITYNSPRWLLAELVKALPKDYVYGVKSGPYSDSIYVFKVSQILSWYARFKESVTPAEDKVFAKTLLDAFTRNPRLILQFGESPTLRAYFEMWNLRGRSEPKLVEKLRNAVGFKKGENCAKQLMG